MNIPELSLIEYAPVEQHGNPRCVFQQFVLINKRMHRDIDAQFRKNNAQAFCQAVIIQMRFN